jgi:transcriptional regulator with XRE-family HTH domain
MSQVAMFAAARGFTDKQVAKLFGVTKQTLTNWKREYPQFFASLKRGKAVADDQVELSLFQRAVGYSHPDVHITSYLGRVTITPIIRHYPPDTAAAFIWLKNRRPDNWRDRVELDHGVQAVVEIRRAV